MYAASWKFRGLGFSPLDATPSPWPSAPWQSAQRLANRSAPGSSVRPAGDAGEALEPLADSAAAGAGAGVATAALVPGVLDAAASADDLAPPPQPELSAQPMARVTRIPGTPRSGWRSAATGFRMQLTGPT